MAKSAVPPPQAPLTVGAKKKLGKDAVPRSKKGFTRRTF